MAMRLLWPDNHLTAIAVEGLSPADQNRASAQTVEIADITLYFDGNPEFEQAGRTTLVQFKYSIAAKDKCFRAADAKKTVEKFGATYREYEEKYGPKAVQDKLGFQLVTNQPILPSLSEAIESLASNTPRKGDVENQAEQFRVASGLSGSSLEAFAGKVQLFGQAGSLPKTKNELGNLVVDWSATDDPIAAARLGKLRDLVREKAGYAGTNQNLIRRTDILAAFEVGDPKDLLPCESKRPNVGQILERGQLADAIARSSHMTLPLLIHAPGGVGKSVFMDILASKLSADHEVVSFDCFGGGAYRSPEDARHLPNRGLIHIANTLAFRGLCDPILPDSPDVPRLLRTFRRRLIQCLKTISRVTPGRKLALFFDAIDNADIIARQRSEDCFPLKLLEALDTEPVAGVKLILSCRLERKPTFYARCEEFQLRPLTRGETESFLRARLENPSQVEINVAHARSGGNPRILDYLLKAGRGLLDPSEIDKSIELDDLIAERITEALSTAIERGYQEKDIGTFLAGLAVLPPPVPLCEYAGAHDIGLNAIESFASDLYPLLERTNQGLMFRDEPTETFVRERYASSPEALHQVASNLLERQEVSVYAARALPGLLQQLGDSERLFELAFDERIPSAITSTIGKRNVRHTRLKAATLHAAEKRDYNSLVRLLLELATIAVGDQRSSEYLLDHPDLVIAAQDVDAIRRLFEIQTAWPGTRQACLATANTLSGEVEEATRHVRADLDWIDHHFRTSSEDRPRGPGPKRADIAAIPFFLISQGRQKDAAGYLGRWRDWYAYEVCEVVITYANLGRSLRSDFPGCFREFIAALQGIGAPAAALSLQEFPDLERKNLIAKLASRCKHAPKLDLPDNHHRNRTYELQDGLRKSAAVALSLGLPTEAMAISLRSPHKRPSLWYFSSELGTRDVFAFLFRTALRAAAKNETVHEKDLLPSELTAICSRLGRDLTGMEFRKKAKRRISTHLDKKSKNEKQAGRDYAVRGSEGQKLERFIEQILDPLLALTRAFSVSLGAHPRNLDEAFCDLITIWGTSSKIEDTYHRGEIGRFFRLWGFEIAFFSFWSLTGLKPTTVKRFLTALHAHEVGARRLVRIVAILAQRKTLQTLAAEQALKARALIEKGDEVAYRASLFGSLGRAMLPVSVDEASFYFRHGIEQIDAIDSADRQFTDDLLLFAAQMRGDELDERDFHTLTNICELNLGEEPEKFSWGAYGLGLSRTAGLRGLAKLSRWDDRSRAPLTQTLLPYLTGLLEADKIGGKDALALNLLARPAEFYSAGTKEFAQAVRKQAGPDPATIAELIAQFQDNNPDLVTDDRLKELASLAQEALGPASKTSEYLEPTLSCPRQVRETRNLDYGYGSKSPLLIRREADRRQHRFQEELDRIAAATDPTDEASLMRANIEIDALGTMHDLKGGFLGAIRRKVPYDGRTTYVRHVAALEGLFLHRKLNELEEAQKEWGTSSAALADVYRELALPLVHAHANDFISDGCFSTFEIKRISDLTGATIPAQTMELIKVLARPDSSPAGSVWLALARLVYPEASVGIGQIALKRLLSDKATRLAASVVDGPFREGLYPPDDLREVAAGLIWRVLGSPHATDRWRAAHCLRSFAKFGRWEIIDSVVNRISSIEGGPFQAQELPFFYMHSRLWLLISLARLGGDYPKQVSRYKDSLLAFTSRDRSPHVLMRHFASQALRACIDAEQLRLPSEKEECVRTADQSPHRRLKKKLRHNGGFYSGRPDSVPEPAFQFGLGYDFHKTDVDSLAEIFGQPCWKVADLMSEIVQAIDPTAKFMHDSPGRETRHGQSSYEISSRSHTHGQQLGWHALFLAAGRLLKEHPVTDDCWYEEDPWGEWLGQHRLTRDDGLWLSDGTDRIPLDTAEFLLEGTKKPGTTDDRKKLLGLIGLRSGIGKELIVQGHWTSADGVRVHVSSALVPTNKAASLARELAQEEPMSVWVPSFHQSKGDSECLLGNKNEYRPWIVVPSGEPRLDEDDPYGSSNSNCRPRLSQEFATFFCLSKDDPFGRLWKDKRGRAILSSQAWGRDDRDQEGGAHPGKRLSCASSLIESILSKNENDLLILIRLEVYERGSSTRAGTWTNTVAVVRVMKDLTFEYFTGRVNHVHQNPY